MSYLVNPYMVSASGGTLVFEEDYESTSGWTFVNSQFTIDSGGNGLLLGTNVPDNSLAQAYRDIGFNLPSAYTLKIEYKPTSSTNNIYCFSITETSDQLNSQPKGVLFRTNGGTQINIATVSSGSFTQASYITSLVVDTQYYVKIVNDDSNISMSVFTGSDYETGQVGSTISVSDPNFTTLDTLQHCGRTDGGGGTTSFSINNVQVYDDT